MKRRLFALFLALVTVLQPVLPAAAEEPEAETAAYVTEEAEEITEAPVETAPAPVETTQEATVSVPEETTAPFVETTAAATETTVAPQEPTEPEPVSYAVVRLVCGMDGVAVHVYPIATEEDPEPEEILPQEDGSYHLLPGEYVYSAEYNGETSEKKEFLVTDESEQIIQVIIPQEIKIQQSVSKGSIVGQGMCGDHLTWELTFDHNLYISGYGDMWDYLGYYNAEIDTYGSNAPWFRVNTSIWNIEFMGEITSIGDYAFYGTKTLQGKIYHLQSSIKRIGKGAFGECKGATFYMQFSEGLEKIEDDAFRNSTVGVYPPKSVKYIGERAFQGVSLVKYDFENYPHVQAGKDAFKNCQKFPSGIASLTGFTEVSEGMFQESTVKEVSLPSYITKIGKSAFRHCRDLNKVTIEGKITELPENCFLYCDSLTDLELPDSVTRIGAASLEKTSLHKFVIPPNVTEIGNFAFWNCTCLTEVTIPATVTSIGDDVFEYCPALKTVRFLGTQAQWDAIKIGSGNEALEGKVIVRPDASGTLENGLAWALYDNGRLEISGEGEMQDFSSVTAAPWTKMKVQTVLLENGVTSIGKHAFSNCTNLTSITIPESITQIKSYALKGCTALEEIQLPAGVTEIGQSAFDGTGLKEVTIGDGVASIGEEAFLSCPMTIVTLPESVTRIGAHAIGYVYQARDYQKIEGFIVRGVPGSTAHQYATSNGFAFASSTGPIANTITASDIHVYVDDTKAQMVALNASALGGAALSYRSDSASVTVSTNGIATVAKGFKGTAKITITTEKTDLYLQTSKEITLTASGTGGTFGDLTWALGDDGTLTIAGSGEMGSSGYPWEGYASTVRRLEVKPGVTGIGRSAFSDFEALEEVVLADTVTTIDGSAFSMCGKLSKLNLGSGLRFIYSHAFEFCDSLKEVNIPASASSISPSAFENCGNLQNFRVASGNEDYCDVDGVLFWAGKVLLVSFPGGRTGSYTVPSSVKTIGDCAFYASKLTEVVLPSGLKTIGDECFRYSTVSQLTLPAGLANLGVGAFEGCKELKTVTIPGSVKTVSDSAFWGSGLESVTLEDGVTTIGKDAFLSCGLTKVTIPGTVTSIGEHALGYEVNRLDYDKVTGFTIFGVPGSAAQRYADSSGFTFKGTAAIVYDANGGTGAPAPTEKKRGSTAYLSTTRPTKTGYQFLGWAESPEAVTARYQPGGSYTRDEDITLYAVWKANTYSVRFYANDGTQTSATQAGLNYDETYTLNANTFRRAGYTFLGWAESVSGQVTYADQAQIRNLTETNNAAVTLYAQWKPITYRVAFEAAGGEGQIAAITVQYDESFTMPAPNSLGRTGYRLYQWFDNPEYSYAGKYYSPNATVKNLTTEDGVTLVFYAYWLPNTYSVRFFANNETGGVSVQSNFTYDSPKCLNANPFQWKGYTFAGWATGPEGSAEYADGAEVRNLTAENGAYVDLYARWEPTTYYLNQDADGGTGAQARVALHYGEAYTLPGVQDVQKPGYMLTGWKGKIGKSTKTFKPGDQLLNLTTVEGEEFTLTALWGPLKYTVRFMPGEGGTGKIKTQAMTYGKPTALAANGFKRTGYVFAGWRSEDGTLYDDKEKVSDLTTNPNGLVDLTAQWQPVAYQLVFDANGGTGEIPGSGSLYNCGTGYRIPDAQPTRTGYRFLGWSTKAKGSVMFEGGDGFRDMAMANGKTVILYAVWQPTQYTLNFDGNGGSISVGAMTGLTCDKAVALPAGTFTRPGYVFTGWNTEADGTGTAYKNKAKAAFRTDTGDVTLYAQWQQLQYTVTYKNVLPSLNAGNPGTYTMAEGLTLQPPAIRGKTFEGWYLDAKFTIPFGGIAPGDESARNLTVYAKWSGTAREYGIWFFGSGATGDTKYMEGLYSDKEYTLRANAFKRPGYRFLGWSREENGEAEFTDKQKIVNLEPETGSYYYVNLYAVWEPISYTITYKGVTQEEIRQLGNPETFTAADQITLSVPRRPGYRFEGWYETAKFTGYSNTIYGSLTAKNLTLYAKWTDGGTKYTVTFDGNGATSGKSSSKALSFCQDLKLTNMGFKRTGYQFLGWSTDPKAEEPAYVLGQTVHDLADKAETVTQYAVWEAIPYTVTLKNVAGAQVPGSSAGTLTYTAAGLTLPTPSREGAVFEGWYTTANFKSGTALKGLPAGTTGNLTLYAKWRVTQ